MRYDSRFHRLWRGVCNYLIFFLLVAFVITCCMLLFVTTLSRTLEITFTGADLNAAAKLTMLNVVLLSLLFTLMDFLRRRHSVMRPIKNITDGVQRIMHGDFSVRLDHVHGMFDEDVFNTIVDCFNRMAQELSGTETLRTDFIANVSHELKTPLAIMQNYGTLLSKPGLPEEQRIEYARAITDTCHRLAHLITNILKLNKLENQQIFPTATEFDLGEQLCECLLQFESEWENKQIAIETDIAEDVRVCADAELLVLVWNNLLSNAFKFTEPGGTVAVELTATANHAVVCVRDTGCGMTPEVGAHIFEKFYQADTSHATRGNGLGLSLVKRVVDILQGQICVESVSGQGSTFTVKIRKNQ